MTKQFDQLRVRKQRNARGIVHRIKVRDEGNRKPVASVDMVIAAYDDSGFARTATTQRGRSLGAHAREIDGRMPGSRERPVVAIGLFEQQRGLCMSLTRHCCKQAYNQQNK